jgi:hypothetical protein
MIPKENTWSIVINGHWNRMIFTPNWIGKKIFKSDKVEYLVSMMPTAPVVYQKDDLRIAISEEKLIITLLKLNRTCMEEAEAKAIKILELLYHTPVSAIGVNFGFTEESPSRPLLDLFAYRDNADIGTQKWDISQNKLTRCLKGSDNKLLNLTLSFDGSKVDFDGNFHQSVKSAKKGAAVIKGCTDVMYGQFMKLLKEVYGLSWQEGDQ